MPWQEMHPALLCVVSSSDCPGNRASIANRLTPPATAAIDIRLETETDIGSHGKQSLVSKDIAEPLRR